MSVDGASRRPAHRHSRARSWVLHLLYGWEMVGEGTLADYAERSLAQRRIAPRYRDHVDRLITLLDRELPAIDVTLERAMPNWRLERVAAIDRAALRIGTAELTLVDEVPPKVAIHEAMRLVQKYGSDESPRFVNGVLDAIWQSTR